MVRSASRPLAPQLVLTVGALCALSARICAAAGGGHTGGSPGAGRGACREHATEQRRSCDVEVPVIGGHRRAASVKRRAKPAAPSAVSSAKPPSAVGNGILELLAKWMIGAATTRSRSFVAREMQQTTTPQLQSAWFQAQFAPMADLGAALGLLVALIALASAAIRRSPRGARRDPRRDRTRRDRHRPRGRDHRDRPRHRRPDLKRCRRRARRTASGRPSRTPGAPAASAASAPRRSRC